MLKFVVDGHIMDRPEGCPLELFSLMSSCWLYAPKKRPTFRSILELLEPDMNERFRNTSYFHNEMPKNPSPAAVVVETDPESIEVVHSPSCDVGSCCDNSGGRDDTPLVLPKKAVRNKYTTSPSRNKQQPVVTGAGGDTVPLAQAEESCDLSPDDDVVATSNHVRNRLGNSEKV